MKPHHISVLARPLALLLLLAGLLSLSANHAAWATPVQPELDAQTVPRRPELLMVEDVNCETGVIRVIFRLERLHDDVSDYGTVAYVVNGQIRNAAFVERMDGNARYIDTIPAGQEATNGTYDVMSAILTITMSGGEVKTHSLQNPSVFRAACPGRQPGLTPQPQPAAPQPGQLCAAGAPRGEIGPNVNTVIANCPWVVFFTGSPTTPNGAIEIRLVQPNTAPQPNAGDIFAGVLADIVLLDGNNSVVTRSNFANRIEICYFYGASELARAGNDPASLTIQFFDSALGRWVALPTSPIPAGGRVCALTNHLTLFSLTTRLPTPSALPNTGEAAAALPLWIWLTIALTLLAVGGLVYRASWLAHR
jgi:hypothetical protein